MRGDSARGGTPLFGISRTFVSAVYFFVIGEYLYMSRFNIVLVEPQIPQNTGNISRTCACTGMSLHLVGPLGFSVDDKHVKRAGLDYWKYLDLHMHDSLESFLAYADGAPMRFASTKAARSYSDADYPDGCFIVFGKETSGLPESLLHSRYGECVRIPMLDVCRSLNLSNSVAVILYEALRQDGFEGLQQHGRLTKY